MEEGGEALKYGPDDAEIHPNASAHCDLCMNITVYFLYEV